MKKMLITLMALSFSFASFAQMSEREKKTMTNRLENSFPEPNQNQRATAGRVHMGLTTGMFNPSGSMGSSLEYGLNVGFQPVVPFGLGLEFTTTELDNSVDTQLTQLLLRGTYNLAGDIPVLRHSYFGVTGGPLFIEDGDTEWAIGPLVGFDIPLQERSSDFLSLGLQAKYLLISDADDSFGAGLNLKYWY